MGSPSNIFLPPSSHCFFIPTKKNLVFSFSKCYYLNFYFTFFNCITLMCDLKFHISETVCTSLSCRMWTTKLDSKKCWKCFNPLAWMIVSHRFKFSYNTKNWLNVSPWASFAGCATVGLKPPLTQPSAPHHTDNLKTKHQIRQAATTCIILSSSWWWAW